MRKKKHKTKQTYFLDLFKDSLRGPHISMEAEESSDFILLVFPNFHLLFLKSLIFPKFLFFCSWQIYKVCSEIPHINENHLRNLAPKSSLPSEICYSGSGSLSNFISVWFQPWFSGKHPSDQTKDQQNHFLSFSNHRCNLRGIIVQ